MTGGRELVTVGVTGTNGKTSTTGWVAAMLGRAARPVACVTTLGASLDGLPFEVPRTGEGFASLLRACREAGGRFAAVEMTSLALSRGFARSWPADVGVLTNVSHDHLDAHGSAEHYLASKAQLFMHLRAGGAAVLNGGDPAAEVVARLTSPEARVIRYGVAGERAGKGALDVEGSEVRVDWSGTTFAIAARGALAGVLPAEARVRTRAVGAIYAENALAALVAATLAGVPFTDAAEALAGAEPPRGRFQIVHASPHVVVDYAHTPDAFARTIATARRLTRGALTVVFGCGGERDREKRPAMGAAACAADRILVTSDNPRGEDPGGIVAEIRAGMRAGAQVRVTLDRAAAIAEAVIEADDDDVVLVAGKGHETEQIVGTERRRFDDVAVVRAAIAERASLRGLSR
jgi:UDP-N-acetylmuramoyl-L-alanyl-D-glutamate--2,6-diaminopimelate ligase